MKELCVHAFGDKRWHEHHPIYVWYVTPFMPCVDRLCLSPSQEKLMNDVEECRARLDRAQKLIGGLGGEKDRWTVSYMMLRQTV